MSLKADIDALVSKFANDLEKLVRTAAVEAVTATLGGNSGARALPAAASTARMKPGPKPKVASVGTPEKATAPKPAAKTTKGTTRLRRSAEDIAQAGEQVAAYVAKNPGSNAERIKAALGIASNQWSLAIGAALASKKVSRKGIKRAALYSPAGSALIAKPAPVPPIKRSK
jgi:hypothetical protein